MMAIDFLFGLVVAGTVAGPFALNLSGLFSPMTGFGGRESIANATAVVDGGGKCSSGRFFTLPLNRRPPLILHNFGLLRKLIPPILPLGRLLITVFEDGTAFTAFSWHCDAKNIQKMKCVTWR